MNDVIYNLKRNQLQQMLSKGIKDYDKIAEWTRVIRAYEKIKSHPVLRLPLRKAKRIQVVK